MAVHQTPYGLNGVPAFRPLQAGRAIAALSVMLRDGYLEGDGPWWPGVGEKGGGKR